MILLDTHVLLWMESGNERLGVTTGVDVMTCKFIVLDQCIESLIEFKQIIGRGTRIHEDAGKFWFTIMDFKRATELFADPDFDGEPVLVYEPEGDSDLVPPDDVGENGEDEAIDPPPKGPKKFVVSGVEVEVIAERVQYYSKDGWRTHNPCRAHC